MLTYKKADEQIKNLHNLDIALYGDTKGEIRQVIINKLEKYLFDVKDNDCPERYMEKLIAEEKDIQNLDKMLDNDAIFLKKKDKFNRIKYKTINKGLLNDIKIRDILGTQFVGSNLSS